LPEGGGSLNSVEGCWPQSCWPGIVLTGTPSRIPGEWKAVGFMSGRPSPTATRAATRSGCEWNGARQGSATVGAAIRKGAGTGRPSDTIPLTGGGASGKLVPPNAGDGGGIWGGFQAAAPCGGSGGGGYLAGAPLAVVGFLAGGSPAGCGGGRLFRRSLWLACANSGVGSCRGLWVLKKWEISLKEPTSTCKACC